MTGGAILISRVRHIVVGGLHDHAVVTAAKGARAIVTFEADGKNSRPREHLRVGGSMRQVTDLASVDAHGGVFINEGAALVGVAFEAGLLIRFLLIDHARTRTHAPGCGEGAVRIMAIRAFDDAFVHTMLEGHGKLRLDGGMAGITKLGLFFRQEKFRGFRIVDGVAVGADHILLGVNAAADVGAGKGLRVAAETGVESLFGSDFGERDDGRLAAVSVDVGLAGSMAALTTVVFGRFLAGGGSFIMRVAEKLVPQRRVTSLAGFAANVIGAGSKSGQKESGQGHSKGRHYPI